MLFKNGKEESTLISTVISLIQEKMLCSICTNRVKQRTVGAIHDSLINDSDGPMHETDGIRSRERMCELAQSSVWWQREVAISN